jgi:histidinol-phosphate aminotransferase
MLSPRLTLANLPPAVHGAHDYKELTRLGLFPDAVVDFSVNCNPYGPHPTVLQAAQAAISPSVLSRYPDRDCLALRAAIAAVDGIPEEYILPGNGVTELIQLVALAFVTPGSRHLVLAPTFGEYERAIQLMGGHVQSPWGPSPLRTDLRFEAGEVAAAIRRWQPDGVWLCNPNNPTGQQWSAVELAQLRTADPANQALWVVDEAYHHFAIDPVTLKDKLDGPNLIIFRSLTKDMALAGLRLGYALAAPAVIDLLRRAQPSWSVNSLAQIAGVTAMQAEVLAWRQESLSRLHQRAATLWSGLAELGLNVLPTTTTYTLVAVGDAAVFRRRLLAEGLLVRDCTSFGLPRHVRIAARRSAENERLLATLKSGGILE